MKTLNFMMNSVFTDERYWFSGNPVVVFWGLQEDDFSIDDYKHLAYQMHCETSFIFDNPDEKCCEAKIRTFTGTEEIKFSGHAVMGSAYAILDKKLINLDNAEDGKNKVSLILPDRKVMIELVKKDNLYYANLTQDEIDLSVRRPPQNEEIAQMLNISPEDIFIKPQFVTSGLPALIVGIKDLNTIRQIRPNTDAFETVLADYPSKIILCFTEETIHDDSDFHVRMFAPTWGIKEDPASGLFAGSLLAYLDYQGLLKSSSITIEQGYEVGLPSKLHVGLNNGNLVTTGVVVKRAEGSFYLP